MRKPFALPLAVFACVVSLFTLANAQPPNKEQGLALSSLSNGRQLATAMMMYCQDYDEMLPHGKTMTEVKPKVFPYVKNNAIFVDPTSGKDFMYNPVMSGMPQKRIKEPAQAVVFYSPSIHTDGMFTIGFADGHCKRQTKVPNLIFAQNPSKVKKAPVKSVKPLKKKR